MAKHRLSPHQLLVRAHGFLRVKDWAKLRDTARELYALAEELRVAQERSERE